MESKSTRTTNTTNIFHVGHISLEDQKKVAQLMKEHVKFKNITNYGNNKFSYSIRLPRSPRKLSMVKYQGPIYWSIISSRFIIHQKG